MVACLYIDLPAVCVSPHRHGQLVCVRLLLELGARIVPDNEGVSPLELCAQVITTVPSHAVHCLGVSVKPELWTMTGA